VLALRFKEKREKSEWSAQFGEAAAGDKHRNKVFLSDKRWHHWKEEGEDLHGVNEVNSIIDEFFRAQG